MSAPVRPDPDPSRPNRVRQRVQQLFERSSTPPDAVPLQEPAAGATSRGLTALIASGAALVTLGVLLGWQSWSSRSAQPLDDRLPFLEVAAATNSSATNSSATDSSGTDGTPPPGQSELPSPAAESPAPGAGAAPAPADVIVHVAGAVAQPGVVSLPSGSRVFQAIELAGGAGRDADLDRVNLAAVVTDGERIHVPEVGQEVVPALLAPTTSDMGLARLPTPLDVNTAAAEELEVLRGIGPSLAQAIVTTRSERGPFRSVDELLEVPGIGDAKLAQLRDQVTV